MVRIGKHRRTALGRARVLGTIVASMTLVATLVFTGVSQATPADTIGTDTTGSEDAAEPTWAVAAEVSTAPSTASDIPDGPATSGPPNEPATAAADAAAADPGAIAPQEVPEPTGNDAAITVNDQAANPPADIVVNEQLANTGTTFGSNGTQPSNLQAELTLGGTPQLLATPVLVKDLVSSVQIPGKQDWVTTYTLAVTNPNAADPVVYDLSDTIGYPAGVSVTAVVLASNDIPPGTINPAFDGSADQSVATGVTLAGGAADVYTLQVTATVPATLSPSVRQCAQGPGSGFYNQGAVTILGQTETAEACGDIPPAPLPTIAKTLAGAPVQQPDGSWTTVYAMTVTNPSPGIATVYSLTDTLEYGPGIVINSSAVTSTLPVSPTWDGLTDVAVFGEPRIIAPATTDTYTVTVNATVPPTVTPDVRDCVIQTTETGSGFLNTGDLTSFTLTEHAEACGAPASPALDKTFVSAAQHLNAGIWNGTTDFTYTIVVDNPSPITGLIYTLTETPKFPPAVMINGGTVVGSDGTDPITVLNPTFPGSGTFDIVTDRPLPAGGTDTYTIVLNATVPADFDPALGECTENTPGNGFYNSSDATSGEDTFTDQACGTVPQIPNPTVTKTVASVTPGTAKGTFVVAYDVTVSNPSTTTEASYDLTDTPAFPTQVTISDPTAVVVRSNLDGTESQAPTAIAGWFSGGPLGTGQALPAGKKDTYRVSVLATVPPSVPTTVLECSGSTSELGFFNAARMTIGQDVYDVDACAPIPPPEPPATATTPSTPTTTPSTPTTPTTPTKTPSTPTGAQLPNTGVDVGGSIVVALLLLGLGALVLVLAGRRRRGSH